jgi:hypothetical protein
MNFIWTKFKESKIGIFLSNPIVGLVLSCVVAIFIGYFFYILGDKSPHLAFRASPVRSSIVSAGGMSDLSVSFREKKVTGDLTVMQVAIWNEGRGSIRHENILEPITISAGTNVPIFSATIRTATRGVVGFNLITNELSNGKLSFDWKIMEHNDGASVQILYGGNQDVKFKSEGIIEGQHSIAFYVADYADSTSNFVQLLGMLGIMFWICPNIFKTVSQASHKRMNAG